MKLPPDLERKCLDMAGRKPAPANTFCLPELPFPPSVNTYWRRVGNKTLLSEAARTYRKRVLARLRYVRFVPFDGPVKVIITFRPPDRRVRDLDNLPKGLLDALKYAGVYADDSQVRHLDMCLAATVQKGGASLVTVTSMAAGVVTEGALP